MSLASKIKQHSNIAVLSRNYREHLEAAEGHHSSRLITFRSLKVWRSAEEVLKKGVPIPIYFIPVNDTRTGESSTYVEYVATLQEVILNPDKDSEKTRKLLEECVGTTEEEGFWDGTKTLYRISNCRELKEGERVELTELKKLSDDNYVSKDFGYSYALVHTNEKLEKVRNKAGKSKPAVES